MSTSRFSVDDHARLRASPATAAGNSQGTLSQPPSRAVGVETVRSLTLMLMAACLTTLVLLTQLVFFLASGLIALPGTYVVEILDPAGLKALEAA